MLGTGELAQMQTVLNSSLPGTAVVQRYSGTSDSQGGQTRTWSPLAGGTVACRLSPISGAEIDLADRIAADSSWVVTLPHDQDVTEKDRIVTDSRTFEVLAVHDRSWEISRRVECKEIE